MLDPIVAFMTRVFAAIGRGIGLGISFLLRPFVWVGSWYTQRGWIVRGVVGGLLLGVVVMYGAFLWQTQRWTGFNPDYATAYNFVPAAPGTGNDETADATADAGVAAGGVCRASSIVTVTADLIDFNVNQNAWISSTLAYKVGFFGVDWDHTPFMDNKASFQRGVNQALRRTTVELVDTLGRVRGTSQVDNDLQSARGALQFDESTWYIGFNPPGPKTPTPSFYRQAEKDLTAFNTRMVNCTATFNPRGDNLLQFLDRIASDLGSTSDILRDRSDNYSAGWFDTRADDRFWFTYGQLYAYYGILHATSADFHDVIETRGLRPLWDKMEQQLRASLNVQPFIISNGEESGWVMPTHLATIGFYVLRVRSNIVEMRSVLDR
jgi:hypothetical protein